MEQSGKFAWTWNIKEERVKEYVEMHLSAWSEILEEHRKAGIRNYSIFQNGKQFFYCFECDDLDEAFAYLAHSEPCQRWNAITSTMVEGSFDLAAPEPITPMREIFYLK